MAIPFRENEIEPDDNGCQIKSETFSACWLLNARYIAAHCLCHYNHPHRKSCCSSLQRQRRQREWKKKSKQITEHVNFEIKWNEFRIKLETTFVAAHEIQSFRRNFFFISVGLQPHWSCPGETQYTDILVYYHIYLLTSSLRRGKLHRFLFSVCVHTINSIRCSIT